MKPCKIKMIRNIQQLAFAVHETVLYLDSHPKCKNALSYYHKQNEALQYAIKDYEQNYGPLTQYSVSTDNEWTWASGPWPWEYEANLNCSDEVNRHVVIR